MPRTAVVRSYFQPRRKRSGGPWLRGPDTGTFARRGSDCSTPRDRLTDHLFRRAAGEDDSKLTGPQAAALVLDSSGCTANPTSRSHSYVRCSGASIRGYPAIRSRLAAALMARWAKTICDNFGAATGPDFRRAYIDKAPTSNIDMAAPPPRCSVSKTTAGPHASRCRRRLLKKALRNGRRQAHTTASRSACTLDLPGQRIVTTVEVGPDRRRGLPDRRQGRQDPGPGEALDA